MKIAILAEFPLHVIPQLESRFPQQGHYATWLPQLAEAYEHFSEFRVFWVIVHPAAERAERISWKNQIFQILPTNAKGRSSSFYARDRLQIKSLLRDIQPDIVHGWGTEDVYGYAAVRSGYKNIISMQGILSHYVLRTRMNFKSYFQAILECWVLRRADLVTVESVWGKNILRPRRGSGRIEIVEYGVQKHFFDFDWKPDQSRPIAIFVGSLHERKGIQDAIEAFKDPALNNCELWVVGDGAGQWAETLQANAPANVCWMGRRTSVETAGLLSQAWCLVLPTRADTSPNVVKEARVIGLPVISTPCGGQSSYVIDQKNGFLVGPGEIEDLRKSLKYILHSYDKCRSMGDASHLEQRQIFDSKRTAELFRELYIECAK